MSFIIALKSHISIALEFISSLGLVQLLLAAIVQFATWIVTLLGVSATTATFLAWLCVVVGAIASYFLVKPAYKGLCSLAAMAKKKVVDFFVKRALAKAEVAMNDPEAMAKAEAAMAAAMAEAEAAAAQAAGQESVMGA